MSSSSANSNKPLRLTTEAKQKVWGSTHLAPWFPNSKDKVGEVWFHSHVPLLVKFLFTTEKLSVQVHPGDEFAARHENSCGKTEMWHILRAEPGAQIAIGLREAISPERLRQASLSGEIEQLLHWVDVKPGDTFLTPAGTLHAIGAGLALCEIQQHSDVTYRLYDYGRPRELHLDKAVQVSTLTSHDGRPVPLPVECEYFHTGLVTFERAAVYSPETAREHLLIVTHGAGDIGGEPYRAGEVWQIPAGAPRIDVHPAEPSRMLRTWVP